MSISLRLLGRVSRITLLTYQSEDYEGYYKAREAEQVHRCGDDRDAVGVRVEPYPVADNRAVVGSQGGCGRGDQASERAHADHYEEARARIRRENRHGDEASRATHHDVAGRV